MLHPVLHLITGYLSAVDYYKTGTAAACISGGLIRHEDEDVLIAYRESPECATCVKGQEAPDALVVGHQVECRCVQPSVQHVCLACNRFAAPFLLMHPFVQQLAKDQPQKRPKRDLIGRRPADPTVCRVCKGTGLVMCSRCKGSGYLSGM